MVRHVVAWNYADGYTAEENRTNALRMKEELEKLIHLIPGIESIHLYTDHLESSESDLLLDSVFVNEEALKAYIIHPEHVRVGTGYVKPYVKNRKCVDFVVD